MKRNADNLSRTTSLTGGGASEPLLSDDAYDTKHDSTKTSRDSLTKLAQALFQTSEHDPAELQNSFGGSLDLIPDKAETESNSSSATQVSKRTLAETMSWGAMQTVVMAVTSRTITQLSCEEKSLEAAFVLALIVPLSVEYLKKMFNLSGAMKKDLPFNWKFNVAQVVFLLALAPTLYYTEANKHTSPLGYDATIIVPGICLKLLANYLEAHEFFASKPGQGLNERLLPEQKVDIEAQHLVRNFDQKSALLTDVPTATWSNWCAMHVAARIPLLFCATNAGGQYFEAMHIPLAEGVEAMFTNFSAIIAFSVILNELIGSHLFEMSGLFKEVHPNLVPRLLTLFVLPFVLQTGNILTEVSTLNLMAAFSIAFFTDLVVDTAVEKMGLGISTAGLFGKISACASPAIEKARVCVC